MDTPACLGHHPCRTNAVPTPFRALLAATALAVRRPSWAEINDQIRQAPKRWPQLTVGDWELESRAHDGWFADGIHMNWDGGAAFGGFLRPLVIAACGPACGDGGSMLAVGGTLRRARVGVRYVDRLRLTGRHPAVPRVGQGAARAAPGARRPDDPREAQGARASIRSTSPSWTPPASGTRRPSPCGSSPAERAARARQTRRSPRPDGRGWLFATPVAA
jgi:hypothetical protein